MGKARVVVEAEAGRHKVRREFATWAEASAEAYALLRGFTENGGCASVTISVHANGEDCDHE